MVSMVSVCALSAAKRARSVGGSMVWIGVRSVPGHRLGSALGDICWWYCLLGSVVLLSSPAWKVTRRAVQGGVRLCCWAPADLLVPRGGCCVRGECCPAAPSWGRWSSWSSRQWTNGRIWLRCGSHGAAIPMGRLCELYKWPVHATCFGGPWAVGDR